MDKELGNNSENIENGMRSAGNNIEDKTPYRVWKQKMYKVNTVSKCRPSP